MDFQAGTQRTLAEKIMSKITGRGDRIRTCDIYVPNMAHSRESRIEERRRSNRSLLLLCRFPSPKGMVKLVEQG
jgi:hypothetical protein